MNEQNEIVSLIQTLGTSFRILPERIPERLNALSSEQQKLLLDLLKQVANGNAATDDSHRTDAGKASDQRGQGTNACENMASPVRKTEAKLPEPDTYDEISDRSALCRGCPSGCELRWDGKGNYSGYSCIVGQETAGLLAEYYREA